MRPPPILFDLSLFRLRDVCFDYNLKILATLEITTDNFIVEFSIWVSITNVFLSSSILGILLSMSSCHGGRGRFLGGFWPLGYPKGSKLLLILMSIFYMYVYVLFISWVVLVFSGSLEFSFLELHRTMFCIKPEDLFSSYWIVYIVAKDSSNRVWLFSCNFNALI